MNWSRKRHKIIAVADAISVIEKEAYTARKVNEERGGSLVGIQADGCSIILHAIPSGPNAETSWGQIRTDADFQNRHLAAIAPHYKRYSIMVVYLSDYHVHQMGFDRLSLIDIAMLQSILGDPDHSYLTGLPVILVTFHHGMVKHVPYWIMRAGNGVRTEDADLEIVARDDPQILSILKGHDYLSLEEIIRQQHMAMPSLPTPGAENYVAPLQGDILAIRLALEIEHIQAMFSVKAKLRRTLRGYPCLVTEVGGYRLFAVIPSEFPLNPATIFFHKPGASQITEYNARRSWNSIARIADVYEELLEANADSPAINIQA